MELFNKSLRFLLLLQLCSALFSQERIHIVTPGETLSSIARDYDITIEQLSSFNRLDDDHIFPEMELTLPDKDHYIVQRGDNLSSIALRFQVTTEELKQWNQLEDDRILIGQILKIHSSVFSLPGKEYTVVEGDTLWDIAKSFSVSITDIVRSNQLQGDKIFPGMSLTLPASASASPQIASVFYEQISEDTEKGPWFGAEPRRNAQPSLNYGELSDHTPMENYRAARQILNDLDRDIRRMGLLSRDLKGWRIIIDPGHGGLDPGAIVETQDGLGNSAYVVEDEYAYDISIRLYSLLKQHGADPFLTIISPNHHIRSTPDASQTLVNQKNEVYNQEALNMGNSWDLWPRGGSSGLRKRKTAAAAWLGNRKDKSIYISIHCDSTPNVSYDSAVLVWGENQNSLNRSRELAEHILPYLGGESEIREQELEVLKNNPAENSVLIEVRNVADSDNSWILRKEDLRNREVERIFQGIQDYISTR